MGGGNQSSTATQNPAAAREENKEESKESAFKAFKGKGVSLGSDIGDTSTMASLVSKVSAPKPAADEESRSSRNLAAVSAILQ